MRHPLPAILVLCLLTVPALAQNQAPSSPDRSQTPNQAQASSPGANAPQAGAGPAKPAGDSKSPQDNSMADFNVLGSTAQAAFGHDGP